MQSIPSCLFSTSIPCSGTAHLSVLKRPWWCIELIRHCVWAARWRWILRGWWHVSRVLIWAPAFESHISVCCDGYQTSSSLQGFVRSSAESTIGILRRICIDLALFGSIWEAGKRMRFGRVAESADLIDCEGTGEVCKLQELGAGLQTLTMF